MEKRGELKVEDKPVTRFEFLFRVLCNFWNAVAELNPQAFEEPSTTVLWGSIGVNGCHFALARVVETLLVNGDANLTKKRFIGMLKGTTVTDYEFWFTKRGSGDDYPTDKGEAPKMTGAANYVRLGKQLEQEWRANLQAARRIAAASA
jgi:hypothetical protein